MVLLWPGFLILFALIPLIVVGYIWSLRRRRKYTVRFSSLSLVQDLIPRQSWLRRHLPFVLFTLALASLVLAMVRPVATLPVLSGRTVIILALDVSLSMCSLDIPPNRLEAAKAAALSFTERQDPRTRIGIVAFAGFAELIQQPTSDAGLLENALTSLTTARRTAIGSAIIRSLDAIAQEDGSVAPVMANFSDDLPPGPAAEGEHVPHIIVLLTDGVTTTGPVPLDAALLAVERGVRIYTIGFGTESENSPFGAECMGDESFGGGSFGFGSFGGFGGTGGRRFSRALDDQTLIQIAEMTGGNYYSATSASELEEVFRQLPSFLVAEEERTEISAFFAGLGALLALLALLLALIWHPLR